MTAPLSSPATTATYVAELNASADVRARRGTSAPLRRALSKLPADDATDAMYAQAYRAALSESLMLFLHLSKSGGTGLCELAKLNGCSREAAGQSTFSGNCANKFRLDGPWWMPNEVIRKLSPPGLRSFAERSFAVPHLFYQRSRDCQHRGRRSDQTAARESNPWNALEAPATFFAVEGALPENRRCPGILELLVLRDPIKRLASFGRELMRWGLLPQPHAACDQLDIGKPGKVRRQHCDEVKRRVCANYTLMASVAPPVYDNQLTRSLLGHTVYLLPPGGITRDHYLIARERLRSIDVLLALSDGMEGALAARLGWSAHGLQAMYRRQSVPSTSTPRASATTPTQATSSSSSSPPPCTIEGAAMEAARAANKWDLLLYDEAVELEALDKQFFARPAVTAALAPAGSRTPEAPAARAAWPFGSLGSSSRRAENEASRAVGSRSGCGYMSEAVTHTPPSAAARGALGPQPICIHKKWRFVCCWSVGSRAQLPMPRLPHPVACVLPPAGALSSQASVQLPTVAQKHHHAGCALSCRGHEYFGLENAGMFCICLSTSELHAASLISPSECKPSCASSGRLHANHPGSDSGLPCGGSEALAVFSTRHVIDTLDAAASQRAAQHAPERDKCAPMAEPCAEVPAARRRGSGVRALYVRGGSVRAMSSHRATDTADAEYFVYLGCFDALALERKGLAARPDVRGGKPHAGERDDAVMRCSRGCARHAYFAVGPARLVGGGCVCGELATIRWRRDAEGLKGLHKQSLRSLT